MRSGKIVIFSVGIVGMLALNGCKKLAEDPPPENTITTTEVFSSEATATAALIGIYNDMISGGSNESFDWSNGFTSYGLGLSADELGNYYSYNTNNAQFQTNQLQSSNSAVSSSFWNAPYFDVYLENSVIAGTQSSSTLDASEKNQLIGEAEFLRAFTYFYLVNYFGPIPLVNTINYNVTATLGRDSVGAIYALILSDLHDAQNLLPPDYSVSAGQRFRANKWAATALLARVYLYLGNWAGADSAATAVLSNTSLYSLVPVLTNVFLANSNEAIWQLIPNSTSQYATWEQNLPYPANSTDPVYYMTTTLLNAFDSGDQRRVQWVDSSNYSGPWVYYPFKYEVQYTNSGSVTEWYMMLRLAEQYLIRAEAEAHGAGDGITAAVQDMDTIRSRAGVAAYSGATDETSVMNAIMHERQVELFAEWGHRWLDLKRWGNAVSVLTATKGFPVSQNSLLYPIPISELQLDYNLHQNTGY